MHLSGSLKPVAAALIECDKRGWAAIITELDTKEIFIYTPWKEWFITPGGFVTIKERNS